MKISFDLQQASRQLLKQLKQPGDAKGIIQEPKLSPEERAAVDLVKAADLPIDSEGLAEIAKFMNEAPGTVQEKLQALAMAISKEIPLSDSALQALRSASVGNLGDYLRPQEKTEPQRLSKEDADNSRLRLTTVQNTLDRLVGTLLEALSTDNVDKPVLNVENPEKTLYKEGINEANAVDKFEAQGTSRDISKLESSPEVETKVVEGNNEDLSELFIKDDEIVWDQLLDLVEMALESDQLPQEAADFVQKQSYMLLEQRVTPKLMAVKTAFEGTIKDVANRLDQLVQKPQQNTPESPLDKAKHLEKIIDDLDQLIMKSEASLYMSLKNEKRLIALSSNLEVARDSMLKGKTEKATQVVQEVVSVLKSLALEPTLKKVLGLPSFHASDTLGSLGTSLDQGYMRFAQTEKSATGILQLLRRLGLNDEAEAFQRRFDPGSMANQTDDEALTLKHKLLKFMDQGQQNKNNPQEVQQAKEALSHLTGQQLTNRMVDKPILQQLAFSLPVLQEGQLQHMKVTIQTPQDQLKANWKTFDMFFVLDTKVVGQVGIKVRSVDLKLNIEVFNDHVQREALIAPLVEGMLQDIKEMGFSATRVSFRGWHQEQKPANMNKADLVKKQIRGNDLPERGFDVKI